MKLFSSRKSQVELTLQQIIYLVIAIVIVLATLMFFTGLMNIFLGPADSGSEATLNFIYETINSLHNSKNHNTSCVLKASYIEGDWSIVGFNADGQRSADNSDITCAIGKDCIEEQCGTVDQNVEKPSSNCGKGPCICLCDGGGATGIGDVEGDDCKESNAICKKLPQNMFKRFYMDDDNRKICPGGLCDLVMNGESCWGTNRKVAYSIVIKKGSGDSLIFDMLATKDVKQYYPNIVDCKIMNTDLKILNRVAAPAAQTTTPQGNQLKTDMGAVGQDTRGHTTGIQKQ